MKEATIECRAGDKKREQPSKSGGTAEPGMAGRPEMCEIQTADDEKSKRKNSTITGRWNDFLLLLDSRILDADGSGQMRSSQPSERHDALPRWASRHGDLHNTLRFSREFRLSGR